ncbi:TPA: hypothetical protein ACPZUA_003892 [Yersinia enterocolitica]
MTVTNLRVIDKDKSDPETERSKEIIKQMLTDLIEKVDEEDITTFALVAIAGDGSIISANHIINNHFNMLGGISRMQDKVNRLLDNVNIHSEQEY